MPNEDGNSIDAYFIELGATINLIHQNYSFPEAVLAALAALAYLLKLFEGAFGHDTIQSERGR